MLFDPGARHRTRDVVAPPAAAARLSLSLAGGARGITGGGVTVKIERDAAPRALREMAAELLAEADRRGVRG
jgi:hypothetical protein